MHLLTTTTFPINQIAAQVGYNSRQHFIRQFKNLLGVTPIEYRKSQKTEILSTHPHNDHIYPVEKITDISSLKENHTNLTKND